MILSIFTTIFAAIGILFTLLTALSQGFYMGSVPTGTNGMGLIVPFATAIIAGLAAVVAGILVVPHGGLDGLGFSRPALTGLIIGAAVLIGVSIMGAFMAWAEKHRLSHPGLLAISGVVLPLGYFGFVLLLAWGDPATMRSSMLARSLGAMTGLAILSGFATSSLLIQAQVRQSARNAAHNRELALVEQKETDRLNALTPEQKLLEDLSKYDAAAPLWTLTAGLPDEKNPSLRAIWIQRALQVPAFEQELQQTITCDNSAFRHGCSAFIAEIPEAALQREKWAPLLAQDAKLTAGDIKKFRDLAEHDHNNLAQHIVTITHAASRLQRTDELVAALGRLREAVAKIASDPNRQKCLQALDAAATR